MGRRGHAGHPPVLPGKHPPDFAGRKLAQTDLHQRADNAPAHFVKKTVALDDERQLPARFFEVAPREPPRRGFHFVISIGGERFEIMPADKQRRGGAHGLQIERARDEPGALAKQRIHRRVVPDEIAILLAGRVEPGVKFFRGAGGRQHAHVLRQPGIDGQRQFADRHFEFRARHFKMRQHAERVNAGIRAAGTVNGRPAGKQLRQRRLDLLLDAGARLLRLPACVSRAVVGNDQFEFHAVIRET